jgi:hypothetical protein
MKQDRTSLQVDSFKAKAILGMTPPRCRQVRLPSTRQTCTEKGGFESSHSGESEAFLNMNEGQAAGLPLRQELSC